METNKNPKWLCFSGLPDDYPIWTTRFQANAQTKELFDINTGVDRSSNPPGLGDDPTAEERSAHEGAKAAYKTSIKDLQRGKSSLW